MAGLQDKLVLLFPSENSSLSEVFAKASELKTDYYNNLSTKWNQILSNSSVISSHSRIPEFEPILEFIDRLIELKQQGPSASLLDLTLVISDLCTSLSIFIRSLNGTNFTYLFLRCFFKFIAMLYS